MRAIDADALTDEIRKYANDPVKLRDRRWDARCTAIIADMIGTVKTMPTIGGWISVKDRLPEEGVCLGCHGSSVGIYGYVFGEWFDEDDCICGEGYVTHWMPLPKPPKED